MALYGWALQGNGQDKKRGCQDQCWESVFQQHQPKANCAQQEADLGD